MGTEVQIKSFMPAYYSLRDMNEDSNGCGWSLTYQDRTLSNGPFYNGFLQNAATEIHIDCDIDAVKQKMLEHETVFRKQVHELHRLYRIQKDLMDEIRRKELCLTSYNALLASSCSASPVKPMMRNGMQPSPIKAFHAKNTELLEMEPSKVRKEAFDLQLPANVYIDNEDCRKNEAKLANAASVMVDLNQPAEMEDTGSFAFVYPRSHSSQSIAQSHPGSRNAGHSDSPALNSEKLCVSLEPRHELSNKMVGVPAYLSNDQIKVTQTRSQPKCEAENADRYKPPDFVLVSHPSYPYRISASHDFPRPSSLSAVVHWERPGTDLTSSHGIFRPDFGFENKSDNQNGLHYGTSSGTKGLWGHIPLHNYGSLDRSSGNNMATSGEMNGKTVLSEVSCKRSVSAQAVESLETSDGERKQGGHLAVLPWFMAKPAQKNEANARKEREDRENTSFHLFSNQSTCRSEAEKGFIQMISHSNKVEMGGCSSYGKVIGIPDLGKSSTCKNELLDTDEKKENSRTIDINLPCDPLPDSSKLVIDEAPVTTTTRLKCEIDLNSCADEDETSLATADPCMDRKIPLEIDLEAPAFPETEDDDPLKEEYQRKECEITVQSLQQENGTHEIPDEAVKVAAEAILAISSAVVENKNSLEDSSLDNLNWFVNIALRERPGMDYFESMTLKLTEMNEEEHLPNTLIFGVEDAVPALGNTNQAQKGQGRRGRQRRDFQRDILPGLVSLSRHEVAEDLQAFGGLMRATGHAWGPRGTSSRNGSSRGRRKPTSRTTPVAAALKCTSTDVVRLEEARLTVTGWGKMRRPRRQRCPAGNINPISLIAPINMN